MEEFDFESLFDGVDGGGYAGDILERLFGGIIPFLATGDTSGLEAGNWLSTIMGMFNTAGLLAVLIVTSYTIYSVVLDTASDGKTFGQQTDTKYTIMRTMAGLIAFVPVTGGYSLAQVAMLFIVLQGSALGDAVWTRTADTALRGQPLLTQSTGSGADISNFMVQAQFADAFDTLTLGHLCAINANAISGVFNNPNGNPDLNSPMAVYSSPVVTDDRTSPVGGWGIPLINDWQYASATLRHVIRFEDTDGRQYGGRQNFCGAVENRADVRSSLPGTSDISFADQIAGVRIRSQFDNYVQIINRLSNDARAVATAIYEGERSVPVLEQMSRTAVRTATTAYVSGASTNLAFSDDEAERIHEGLLLEASERGWAFAPAWQRGITMGATWYGSPDGDLNLEAHRENSMTAYLRGSGVSSGSILGLGGDPVINGMLSKAEDDFRVWNMMTPYLQQLGDPEASEDAENASYAALARDAASIDLADVVNFIYRQLLGIVSPAGWVDGYTDPMAQVSYMGKSLATLGGFVTGAGLIAEGASASGGIFTQVIPGLSGLEAVGRTVSGWVMAVGIWFLVAGFIIGTMVPMIPLVYFFSAVVSWVLLVVESMFAVPLAVLSLFAPAREGTLIGSWNRILLSIFGIFFRPFFTVVGLIFAMMVLSFALRYLYDLFYILMEFMVPSQVVWSVVSMIGFLTVFVLVSVVTVLLASQLITELGDGAMNWLGVTFGALANRMDIGREGVMSGGLSSTAMTGRFRAIGAQGKARQSAFNKRAEANRVQGGGGDVPPGRQIPGR